MTASTLPHYYNQPIESGMGCYCQQSKKKATAQATIIVVASLWSDRSNEKQSLCCSPHKIGLSAMR